MKFIPSHSLATRAALLLALIACVITGSLGMVFYHSARVSLSQRIDTQLISRVEHFRRVVDDRYTEAILRERPVLSETMLGAEQDVLIMRRRDQIAFIRINPLALPLPALPIVPPQQALTLNDVQHEFMAGGVPVYWVAASTRSGLDGALVDIIAAHPFNNEMTMIETFSRRIVFATTIGVLAATLLAYGVMQSGLRPLRRVAAKAAEINSTNLAARLEVDDAPVEVRRVAAAFNAMLDRIARGYERLSQFSADLAHEIRTPVGALIGQTQVGLSQPRTPEEYRELLESNLEELNRLRSIVANILFLAQADHETLTIERAPILLKDELLKIADYFEGPADENGMKFDVCAEGVAYANPQLCQRAINNLVVNAVRYGARGTTVRLSGAQHGGGASIAVENDGESVRPEQLGRLFDRFHRGDEARSSYSESNGLGLAIVKAIMSLHGGEAHVSCPNSGSIRFELRFPPPPSAGPEGA